MYQWRITVNGRKERRNDGMTENKHKGFRKIYILPLIEKTLHSFDAENRRKCEANCSDPGTNKIDAYDRKAQSSTSGARYGRLSGSSLAACGHVTCQ